MPDQQPELFETRQTARIDPETGQPIQEVVEADPEIGAATADPTDYARESRREALERLRRDGEASRLRAALARLYWRCRKQIVTDGDGVAVGDEYAVYALTDKEAAYLLDTSVSSINGRRNELMGQSGAPPAYDECPVVTEVGRRRSVIDDSGTKVTAYCFREDLFAQLHDE